MGEHVTFSVGEEGSGQGYLALPAQPGPAVIVIQEWWGLVGHICDIVDRLAAEGFVAYAPDLYHGQATTEPDTAKKLMMELELERAGREIVNAAAWLRQRPEAAGSGVGTVGFCMGGTLSIWAGTLSDDITACVGFYPGGAWQRHAPEWSRYSGKAAVIHCSEGDGTSSAPGIQEAKREIEAAGGTVALYDYPGTQHAFFNDDRPEVFDAEAAELSWQRTLAFLSDALTSR